ncbi:MAG: FxsA family protein [Intrasporangium sp.]|uniref:FxsA family protein n=1 Tax=Intrasporangium sp. TaxID=1925024 RepID=UPI002647AA4B|nr:FxsA family protein [Intrasporangium sp.]MDN5795407.1 FxsA family protein [Intrasporangium sp.]
MGTQPRRRLRPTRFLGLAFVALLILEVLAIRFVALRIGGGLTFLLLLATCALGGWVVAHEGRRRWQALDEAVRAGRPPQREVADGILVLLGGLLLLLPGFVSDVFGLLLLLPPTRALARRLLVPLLGRHLLVRVTGHPGAGSGPGQGPGPRSAGQVIQGHVVPDDEITGEVIEGDVVDPEEGPEEGRRP